MKKRLAAFAVCLISGVSLLCACGDKEKEDETVATQEQAESAEAEAATSSEAVILSVADYKTCEYPEYTEEVSEEEVAEYYLAQIDEYNAYGYTGYEKLTDRDGTAVEAGETVNIDYVGTIDGEEFDGGTDTGVDVTLGEGMFLDEFEDGIVGAVVGETNTVSVTFPDDYFAEEVAGSTAEFKITVNYIEETVPITEDNGYYYIYGYETYDECMDYLCEYLVENHGTEEDYIEECKTDYINRLLNESEFADVSGEVEKLYNRIYAQLEIFADNYGTDLETFATSWSGFSSIEEFESYYRYQAEYNVRMEYLFNYIAGLEGIEVSEEEIDSYAQDFADMSGYETGAQYISFYDSIFGDDSFEDSARAKIIADELFDTYVVYTPSANGAAADADSEEADATDADDGESTEDADDAESTEDADTE